MLSWKHTTLNLALCGALVCPNIACGEAPPADGTEAGAPGAPGAGGSGGGPSGTGMPLGIPAPSFGLTEVAGPVTIHANATTEIPLQLPPGTVVEVSGDYAVEHRDGSHITCSGTAANPVFIRGTPGHRILRPWDVLGTYCILENLLFTDGGKGGFAGSHLVLRNSEVIGTQPTGGFHLGRGDNLVIYRNKIHHGGDVNATFDQDVHGTTVAGGAGRPLHHAWILENTYHTNSGDAVQVNGGRGGQTNVHHIYIGRNLAYGNKQTGFWTKQASDVIMSENVVHDMRPSDSSLGQCYGAQYSATRVWFIANKAYNCSIGFHIAGSDSSYGGDAPVYYIANAAWNIHGPGFNPGSGYSNACFLTAGGTARYVINNSCNDADSGYRSPAAGIHVISGNTFTNILDVGAHMFVEPSRANVTATNNLTDESARTRNVNCSGCVVGTPGYANPATGDLSITSSSAAIDKAGAENAVYAEFQARYGIDIRRDAAGTERPQGSAWDIGAYELKR